MEKITLKKNERLFQSIYPLTALLVTVLTLVFVGQGQAESDTLWHIKVGRWILENGIPYTDPFSWTMRGQEWFAHEWLWEASAALVFDSFGSTGIWLFTCLWVIIFCGVLWALLNRYCSLPRATLIYSIATVSSSICWNARPHPMAQALFALTMFILLSCRDKPRLLILLPPVTLVWANMHGSAPLGVLLAAFFCLITCGRINLRGLIMNRLPAGTSRLLGIATIASFIASLLNPHGIGLWLYMWYASRNPLITSYIAEWQSPDFHNPAYLPIAILTVALIWLLYFKRAESVNRVPLFELILACGFLFLTLQQKRHEPYFYFTSALMLGALTGREGLRATHSPASLKTGIAVAALGALAVLTWIKPPTWIDNNIPFPKLFPVAAVEHLQQQGDTGRLFNHYNYGGYLIWMDVSPFIDGRADMYAMNSDIFRDYMLLTTGSIKDNEPDKHLPQHYLDKYEIETILYPSGSRLDLYLINHPGWIETYRDDQTVIYRRAGG